MMSDAMGYYGESSGRFLILGSIRVAALEEEVQLCKKNAS
jgi:hypothetical protein